MLRRSTLALDELERQTLIAGILALEAVATSFPSHLRGGWRAPNDWLASQHWLQDRFARLLATIPELDADPATMRGWAVVTRKGGSFKRHVHSAEYAWSGVLYVEPGGSPGAATIFDRDLSRKPPIVERVEPEIGLVVVFPTSMGHCVEEHQGDGARVTVAFDVKRAVRSVR